MRGGICGRATGEKFAERLAAAGGQEEVGRYGQVIKIPLRDSGAVLAATERDFDESGIAFAAFGAQFLTEDVAEELDGVLFVADADVIDSLERIHGGIALNGGELAAE